MPFSRGHFVPILRRTLRVSKNVTRSSVLLPFEGRSVSEELQLILLKNQRNDSEKNKLMMQVCSKFLTKRHHCPELAGLIHHQLTENPEAFEFADLRYLISFLTIYQYLDGADIVRLSNLVDGVVSSNKFDLTHDNLIHLIAILKSFIAANHYPPNVIEILLNEKNLNNLPDSVEVVKNIGLIRDSIKVEKCVEYGKALPWLDKYLTKQTSLKRKEISNILPRFPKECSFKEKVLVKVYLAIKDIYTCQAFSKNLFSFSDFPETFIMPTVDFDSSFIENLSLDSNVRKTDCTAVLLNHRSPILMVSKLKERLLKQLGFNVKMYASPVLPSNLCRFFLIDLNIKINK